ncbi:MAG: Thiol-disulfide oxidoreductase ResA [Saprospiraceae bacterium]|nr:Thiol-disulfide oxidoreductase ResA [Saprospiraceae bacterium]
MEKFFCIILLNFATVFAYSQEDTLDHSAFATDLYIGGYPISTSFVISTIPKSLPALKGVPDTFNNYFIFKFPLHWEQSLYENFKNGYADELDSIRLYQFIDTSLLSEKATKNSIFIISNLDKKGIKQIIVDANNNFDFSDDIMYTFEPSVKYKKDIFDNLAGNEAIISFEYYDGKKTVKRNLLVEVRGFSPDVIVNPRNPSGNHYVIIAIIEHRQFSCILNDTRVYGYISLKLGEECNYSNYALIMSGSPVDIRQKPLKYLTKDSIININNMKYKAIVNLKGDKIIFKRYGDSKSDTGDSLKAEHLKKIMIYNLDKSDSISFRDLRADYYLLDFWATWCRPCLEEAPRLISLKKQLGMDRLKIIGISVDDDVNHLKRFLDNNKELNWFHSIDNASKESIAKHFNVNALPTYILLDKSAKEIIRENSIEKIIKKIN